MNDLVASKRRRRDDGIALPVVLLGLVAMGILVTGVLVTTSTEVGNASAHQASTRSVYVAENALEAYVAAHGASFATMTASTGSFETSSYVPAGGPSSEAARVIVTRLGRAGNDTYYSVLAEPRQASGRTLVALATVTAEPGVTVQFALSGAVSVGNTIDKIEEAFISGRQRRTTCDDGSTLQDTTSTDAIRFTTDAGAPRSINNSTLECRAGTGATNCVKQETYSQAELLQRAVGVSSFASLAARATKRFGAGTPITWGSTGLVVSSWANATVFSPGTAAAGHREVNHVRNIGCPVTTQPLNTNGTTRDGLLREHECATANSTHWPVVDINVGGGNDVKLFGHGQGMLIVRGGNIEVGSDFRFKGVIVAEGKISMDQRAVIVGAVVSRGDASVANSSAATEIDKVTMQFDRCAIQAAQQAFNQSSTGGSTAAAVVNRTSGWFEIVR